MRILLATLLFALSSCFTTSVWTDDDEDYEERDSLDFVGKLCLTPIAVCLDLITWPLQEYFWNEDEEEDC